METFHKVGSRRAIVTEAASLRWLLVPGGAAVARLKGVGSTWLTTGLLDPGTPSRVDAERFGRRLAVTHAAGAGWWGQAPLEMSPSDLTLAELPGRVPEGGQFVHAVIHDRARMQLDQER